MKEATTTPFVAVETLLAEGVHTGTIATAIEKQGAYTWDRYGRFVLADDRARTTALDALAARHQETTHAWARAHLYDPAEEGVRAVPANMVLALFGWPENKCPDFEAIGREVDLTPEPGTSKAAETRRRDTLLCIIAALADQAGIDPSERGSAGRIAEWTEHVGAAVGDDTIRKVLSEVSIAVERRSK